MNLLGFTGTRSLGDFALVSTGVAMAAGSVVFAGYMLMQADHGPKINGMEYLSLFAQPHGSSHPMVADAPAPARAATPVAAASPSPVAAASLNPIAASTGVAAITPRVAGDSLDMAPTGSIAHATADAPASDGFRILAIEPGIAWMSNGAEIRAIKVGDVAPGLGRVASIEKRDGRWALIDESGAAILARDAAEKKGPPPFERRMIFGSGD